MQFTDDLRKNSASKLLLFRSPARTVPGAGGRFHLNQDQLPHDSSILRRPAVAAAAAVAAPRMQEQDGMADDAQTMLNSLELLSGLLAEPGILSEDDKHFSDDLKALIGPLSSLIERMAHGPLWRGGPALESGPGSGGTAGVAAGGSARGGEPLFMREPLRPALRGNNTPHTGALLGSLVDSDAALSSDAGVLVKSSERLLAAMAGPGVALHISYERGLGELTLSGEDLIRVLVNLVKNAGEAMPGGGRISITVRKGLGPSPSALLTVEDTGIGIPAHAMGQLFQAGFSSKKPWHAWPAAVHRGFGLTIVRDLVEDAGGSVRVVSTLRKGSTFEIKLPCRRR